MQYRAESLGLAGHVSTLLMELIHEQLGLHYAPSDSDRLADRLAPLVVDRRLDSFMDFYYQLKYSPQPDDWSKVMDALSVQETYFWREIDQLRAVVNDIVPSLADAGRGRPVRIWSSACATGEEPLTIAMLLSEAGWFDRAPIQVIASDASPAALARARKGEYGERSFRNLPRALREKYFVATESRWSVVPELHRRVSYDQVNLVDEDQVRRYASSESLLRRTSIFDVQDIGGAFVYVKDAAAHGSQAFESSIETAS
jgi:chemotaxis protein methyltransferase CheR